MMSETLHSQSAQPKPAALVTGAGRRIGRAIAEDLAAHGFAVAVHFNRSSEDAQRVVRAIVDASGHATLVQADLCDRSAVADLINVANAALGRPIGLLVNNASLFEDDSLENFGWDGWDRHFAVHVDAPVMLSRKLAEQLPAGSDGLVVNLIDQRVLKPTPRYFSYSMSKAALWNATRLMAQSLAPHVRVNAIGPGPTLPNTKQSAADFSAVVDTLLLKRGPELAEFGATIRYLWDAKSVTGQMIAIDGGQHLAWQTPDATGAGE